MVSLLLIACPVYGGLWYEHDDDLHKYLICHSTRRIMAESRFKIEAYYDWHTRVNMAVGDKRSG